MAVAVPTIEKVLARYPIKRLVLVADRGLLSLDNLEEIACPIGFVRMR
jgi:transposase